MKKLNDVNFSGKNVLCRCDFNVPVKENVVEDATRIDAALETIDYLLPRCKRLLLCSHLGSPKGYCSELSLKPVYDYIAQKGYNISFVENFYPQSKVDELPNFCLLENLRFYKEEEENDPAFSQFLASLCDVYVNDAFSVSHRAHASVVGVCSYAREKCAGLLLERELDALRKVLHDATRPLTIILGGFKISTKLPMVKHLSEIADFILIGGAMANTFWKAQGYDLKLCHFEESFVDQAREILNLANRAQIILATDFVFSNGSVFQAGIDNVPDDARNYDIGTESVKTFLEICARSKTILWNGPLGMFENDQFAQGTLNIVLGLQNIDAFKVAGGGDTVAFLNKFKLKHVFNYVSLAGGAFLEYIERGSLPGIQALES